MTLGNLLFNLPIEVKRTVKKIEKILLKINVSSGMDLPSPHYPAVILNRPENIPEDGRVNHMFCLFWNVLTGPWRFKSTGQGADSNLPQGPSRVSPTLHRVYKGEIEAGNLVQLSAWTVRPPPLLYHQKDSSGENALLKAALAPGMPPGIFPPYLYIGHYLPPSPSAVSFKRAPSHDPMTQSPPWPSKGPCCRYPQ